MTVFTNQPQRSTLQPFSLGKKNVGEKERNSFHEFYGNSKVLLSDRKRSECSTRILKSQSDFEIVEQFQSHQIAEQSECFKATRLRSNLDV